MSDIRRNSLVLVLILAGAFAFWLVWNPTRPVKAVGLGTADVPTSVAGYTSGGDLSAGESIQSQLPGADIITRNYGQGSASINFLLVSGEHGAALHDPRSCLGSMLLSAPQTERLPGTPIKMHVYQASLRPSDPPSLLVAYFYVANGRIISSPSEIRASLFWGDLLGRQSAPVYFFRFVQPLTPESEARLQTFATQMWRQLQPKIESVTHEKVATTPGDSALRREAALHRRDKLSTIHTACCRW